MAESITTLNTTLPVANYCMGCGVVGTKIYLFGGSTSSSFKVDTIYIFDTTNNTITTSSITLPVALDNESCGVVGTKCYIFGGYSTSRVNTIYVFDTINSTIEKLNTTLPVANYCMGCGVVGTKIYLFGGSTSSSFKVDTIYIFDTTNNTITTSSITLPVALKDVSCGVVGNKCYILGGNYVNTIYVFDSGISLIKEYTLRIDGVEVTDYENVIINGVSYKCKQARVPTILAGTYIANDNPNLSVLVHTGALSLSFTSNGSSFTSMSSSGGTGMYYDSTYVYYNTSDDGETFYWKWENKNYKTITITTDQAVSEEHSEWFNANYTPTESFTFKVVSGDVTNQSLIQWLVDNNATFEKEGA